MDKDIREIIQDLKTMIEECNDFDLFINKDVDLPQELIDFLDNHKIKIHKLASKYMPQSQNVLLVPKTETSKPIKIVNELPYEFFYTVNGVLYNEKGEKVINE